MSYIDQNTHNEIFIKNNEGDKDNSPTTTTKTCIASVTSIWNVLHFILCNNCLTWGFLLLVSLAKWNWGSEKLNNLPKVSQIVKWQSWYSKSSSLTLKTLLLSVTLQFLCSMTLIQRISYIRNKQHKSQWKRLFQKAKSKTMTNTAESWTTWVWTVSVHIHVDIFQQIQYSTVAAFLIFSSLLYYETT